MEYSKNQRDEEVVNLFWSGGWDSTFRLLQLLLIEKRKVQPHYMIWGGDTIGETIEAMQNIRSELFSRYPETQKLMLPINFFDFKSLKLNEEITDAFNLLEENQRVGIQHAWLAQFCSQHDYKNVEQGTEKDSHSHELLKDYLTDYTIDEEKAPKPIYDLFKYFRFPLVDLEKTDMDDIAKEYGWDDIMYMTWFCRRPKNGRPCGFCGNCTDTVIHGMGKRLPLRARIIANLQLPFRKWWRNNYKKRSTGIYKYIKKMLQNRA